MKHSKIYISGIKKNNGHLNQKLILKGRRMSKA